MGSINRVVVVGNLTRDPELRSTASGTSVCRMRVACNTRWRSSETGEWGEKPNFFDVSVFGASAEACARIITAAMTRRHPPRRVVIGRDAYWSGVAKALLPAGLWEWAVRRAFGLGRNRAE